MLSAIILASLIAFVFYYFNRKIYTKNFPGPPVLPFIGNGHQLGRGSSADFLRTLHEYVQKYGSRYQMFVGNERIVALSGTKDIEFLLGNNQLINKSAEYEPLHAWLGTGLLTSAGDKWRKHRKVITPTFHFKILEYFVQIFDSQSSVLVQKLENYTGDKSFDLFPIISLCALDIISEAAMGVAINAQKDSESEYVNAVKSMCRIMIDRTRNPIKRSDFLFRFCSDYSIHENALKFLHNYTYKMIDERRRLLKENKDNLASYVEENSDDTFGRKKKLAFLDMLLLSTVDGKPLDDVSIREEVDTFLFEGHDTTTSGITFTLYLISQHPEVQKKIFEEQKEIFGDDFDRAASYNDLQNMKYLELVIKESLRIYPPVAVIGRSIKDDLQLNDAIIPADTTLMVMIYSMNRNPDVFPEPEKFIPERFSTEESAKRSPYSSVFFSAGPRNCIGQKFAMLEMKSTISKVVRNYELLPTPEKFTLLFDIILRTIEGVKIKIAKRTK